MRKKKIFLISTAVVFSLSSVSAHAFTLFPLINNNSSQTTQFGSHSNINPKVLKLALTAYTKARKQGYSGKPLLTVIDYSLPNTQKRLWVLDLKRNRVVHHTLVAHGKNSGDKYARHFSNQNGSLTSSLGLYVTKNTYYGSKGYSLRLNGLDKGFNDHALKRAIVMHGASYVGENVARKYGRVGRSWGCPSLPQEMAKPVINSIKNGTLVFAYGNDYRWLSHSKFLRA